MDQLHVRKGEKGTPNLYGEWRQRRTARDQGGRPVLDDAGRPNLEWVQRDRPLVKLHHIFNIEQTDDLTLRSRQTVKSEVEKRTSEPRRRSRAAGCASTTWPATRPTTA